MTHKVIHKEIDDGKNLLHVDIMIYNIGEVLLQIKDVNTIVSQVLPLHKEISNLIENGKDLIKEGASDIEWPEIGSRAIKFREDPCEVEPGETQSLQCDFLLDARAPGRNQEKKAPFFESTLSPSDQSRF